MTLSQNTPTSFYLSVKKRNFLVIATLFLLLILTFMPSMQDPTISPLIGSSRSSTRQSLTPPLSMQ